MQMKQFIITIFLIGTFANVHFGQDSIQLPIIENDVILDNPEIYIPVSIVYEAGKTIYSLNDKEITLPTLEAESFEYIKNSEAIQKNYLQRYEEDFEIRGKVNYLITADKYVPFFDIRLLLYYIKSFPDGAVMFQTASNDGKVHAVQVYPSVLLDETQTYIKQEYGYDIERVSFTLYDAFDEPFQLKTATTDKPKEMGVAAPPPTDVKFLFGKSQLGAPPVVLYLNDNGIIRVNNDIIDPEEFDTILEKILTEIENGEREKSSYVNENEDGSADIFIILSVADIVSAEKTVETYTTISKMVADKQMKKYVHYSYPKEADLILRAISEN